MQYRVRMQISRMDVLATLAVASTASAQSVTLRFDADRESAVAGKTIHWTVSAAFTGYPDPAAFFTGFSGRFTASEPGAGSAMNPVPRMGQSFGSPVLDGATLREIAINSLALLGQNDPSSPIVIYEFDVEVGQFLNDRVLEYGASGVAMVAPDDGLLTEPDSFEGFAIESDAVTLDAFDAPSATLTFTPDASRVSFGDRVRWTLGLVIDPIPGQDARLVSVGGRIASASPGGPGLGHLSSLVSAIDPDPLGTISTDSIQGLFVAPTGGPLPLGAEPIEVLSFDHYAFSTGPSGSFTLFSPRVVLEIDGALVDIESITSIDSGTVNGPLGLQRRDLFPQINDDGTGFHIGYEIATNGEAVALNALPFDGRFAGWVCLFDARTGAQRRVLSRASSDGYANFGDHLAMDEGLLVIGTARVQDGASESEAEILLADPGTGDEIGTLAPDEPIEGPWDHIAIGDSEIVASAADTLVVFDRATGAQRHRIDTAPWDVTSGPMAISDGLLAIGNSSGDQFGVNDGAVHLIQLQSGALLWSAGPPRPASSTNEAFGATVAFAGPDLLVGAPGNDESGGNNGVVYRVDPQTGQVTGEVARGGRWDRVGISLAAHGPLIATGSYDPIGASDGEIRLAHADPDYPIETFAGIDGTRLGRLVALHDRRLVMSDWSWSGSAGRRGRVFLYAPGEACGTADLAEPVGVLDLADVVAFAGAFVQQAPLADLNSDDLFDLSDITAFIDAFVTGCP
jgi:outer membrane protein assembly factor BamB